MIKVTVNGVTQENVTSLPIKNKNGTIISTIELQEVSSGGESSESSIILEANQTLWEVGGFSSADGTEASATRNRTIDYIDNNVTHIFKVSNAYMTGNNDTIDLVCFNMAGTYLGMWNATSKSFVKGSLQQNKGVIDVLEARNAGAYNIRVVFSNGTLNDTNQTKYIYLVKKG